MTLPDVYSEKDVELYVLCSIYCIVYVKWDHGDSVYIYRPQIGGLERCLVNQCLFFESQNHGQDYAPIGRGRFMNSYNGS